MSYNFEVESGNTVKFPVGGKYCDRDIVVTATGGGAELARSILDKTVTSYIDDKLTKISAYGFSDCSNLVELEIPNVTYIGSRALQNCRGLTTINALSVTEVADYACAGCVATFNFPKLVKAGNRAFGECKSGAPKLYAPELVTTNGYLCSYSTAMIEAIVPKLQVFGRYEFLTCFKITYIDASSATSIGQNTFDGCGSLKTLIIRSDSVCTLSATSAFNGSGISKGTGFIYVPDNLVEQYKTATNWSTYADQIRAIEDYPEITGGATIWQLY